MWYRSKVGQPCDCLDMVTTSLQNREVVPQIHFRFLQLFRPHCKACNVLDLAYLQ
jgi:hypothetical protein